jgi:hypothetical protein
MSVIPLAVWSALLFLFQAGADRIASDVRHGAPPPVPVHQADDIETRLLVALICAAQI